MIRSRRPSSLTELVRTYGVVGENHQTAGLDASLFSTLQVMIGFGTPTATEKVDIIIEGSSDGTNWGVLNSASEDISTATTKRYVVEHVTKWFRVNAKLTTGTSVPISWATAEVID